MQPGLSDIKVLLFDLDDTLIPSSKIYDEALAACGVDPLDPVYIQARRDAKARLPKGHVSSHHRLLYFKNYLSLQRRFSASFLLKIYERYESALEFAAQREWARLQRSLLMDRLKSRFEIGLITNETTRTQMVKLRAIDPEAKYFKHVVTSEELGVEKPHYRMFERAFELFQVGPKNCLMIGDDLVNDIEVGKSLGCQTFWVQEFEQEPKAAAWTSLNLLEGFLK